MITTELLKFMLRGVLRGIEEYEQFVDEEVVDPSGPLGQLLKKEEGPEKPGKMRRALGKKEEPKQTITIDPSNDLDLEDILKEIK